MSLCATLGGGGPPRQLWQCTRDSIRPIRDSTYSRARPKNSCMPQTPNDTMVPQRKENQNKVLCSRLASFSGAASFVKATRQRAWIWRVLFLSCWVYWCLHLSKTLNSENRTLWGRGIHVLWVKIHCGKNKVNIMHFGTDLRGVLPWFCFNFHRFMLMVAKVSNCSGVFALGKRTWLRILAFGQRETRTSVGCVRSQSSFGLGCKTSCHVQWLAAQHKQKENSERNTHRLTQRKSSAWVKRRGSPGPGWREGSRVRQGISWLRIPRRWSHHNDNDNDTHITFWPSRRTAALCLKTRTFGC